MEQSLCCLAVRCGLLHVGSIPVACWGWSACRQETPLCPRLIINDLSFKVMDEGEMQCQHTCSPYCLLSLSRCLCFLCSLSHTCWAVEGQQLTLLSASAAYMCACDGSTHVRACAACMCFISAFLNRCMSSSLSPLEFSFYFVTVHCPCGWRGVLLLLSLSVVGVCVCPPSRPEWRISS